MDYQNFKRKFMELLQERFEQEVEVSFEQIPKNNGILRDAVLIRRKDENAAPIIYIQEYYEFWQRGISLEHLVERILWNFEECEPQVQITRETFSDYEKLKTHIFFKIVNYERNREQLKKIPHRRFLDLAMIFYYQVDEGMCPATITIENNHLAIWGISGEELEKNARKYTCLSKPAEFLTMEQLAGIEETDDGEALGEDNFPMYVITNKQKQFGAGVILYPGVLQQAENFLGDHFYILPSSVHECILVPDTGNYTQEELVDMVTDINDNHVDPREVLADQAYYYLKKDGKIHI